MTIPRAWASAMPRFTPSVQPKSSALTIRFFTASRPDESRAFHASCTFVQLLLAPRAALVLLTHLPANFSMASLRV